METALSPETSVGLYQITWCHIRAYYLKQNQTYFDFQEGFVCFASIVNGPALMPPQLQSMKKIRNSDISCQISWSFNNKREISVENLMGNFDNFHPWLRYHGQGM
jgi:hypothetical protein